MIGVSRQRRSGQSSKQGEQERQSPHTWRNMASGDGQGGWRAVREEERFGAERAGKGQAWRVFFILQVLSRVSNGSRSDLLCRKIRAATVLNRDLRSQTNNNGGDWSRGGGGGDAGKWPEGRNSRR